MALYSFPKYIVVAFLMIACHVTIYGQAKLSGFVRDAQTGEALPGANVVVSNTGTGGATNTYGFFSMEVPVGKQQIASTFIGYETANMEITIWADTVVMFMLMPGLTLKEASVTAYKKGSYLGGEKAGQYTLMGSNLNTSPAIFGEPDIMKELQTLPGISQGKEGSSEIYVRGGTADQNLLLLDGAPVYNLNHAFGMLSVFNTETIKQVTVQKGGIEARYGGRLSSVVDVNVREGNDKQLTGSFLMGIMGSSLMLEGPIEKEKSSFLVAARTSWADIILMPLVMAGTGVSSGVGYHDINAKANFKLSNNRQLFISYYTGADRVFVKSKTDEQLSKYKFGWGNQVASARFNHLIGQSVFANLQAYASLYSDKEDFTNEMADMSNASHRLSRFNDFGLKYNVDWRLTPQQHLMLGTEQNYMLFTPGELEQNLNGQNTHLSSNTTPMWQSALFADYQWQPGRWQLNPGLRMQFVGTGNWHQLSFEPRLSASFSMSEKTLLKASGMVTGQPIHAVHKATLGWPGYFYVPSTEQIKPQSAWQVSLGALYRPNQNLSFDVDVWYKCFEHLLASYEAPATAFASSKWEDLVSMGKGEATGMDFLAEYKGKVFSSRLSYTASKAMNSFPDYYNGNWFMADYDRLHDLTFTANAVIVRKKRIYRTVSTSFNFRSGSPFMMPTWQIEANTPYLGPDAYDYDFGSADYYPGPNNVRMPTYHRLDVAYQTTYKKKRGERTWNLGIYNVTNRQNPYLYYRDANKGYQQLTMFPFMPYVSLKRTF